MYINYIEFIHTYLLVVATTNEEKTELNNKKKIGKYGTRDGWQQKSEGNQNKRSRS